ncbi:unnamed protein product, partial [marine sediment metagenome]
MIVFNRDVLESGLMLAVRTPDPRLSKAIRFTLGSFTNHNAMIVDHNTRGFLIGEAVAPVSKYTTLEVYESKINNDGCVVKIWRIKGLTPFERHEMSLSWQLHLDGLPYAVTGLWKLGIFRFVNNLPWRIHAHGVWCTELCFEAAKAVGRDPLPKPNGKS